MLKSAIAICLTFGAIGCTGSISTQATPTATVPTATAPTPATTTTVSASPSTGSVAPTTTAAKPVTKSGTFVSGEHETTGTVRIITENGKRLIELDQAFSTSSSGPDLFVILHRSSDVLSTTKPPAYALKEQDYLVIAPLQKYNGSQRYALPDNVKLEDYQSVAIWCRAFNATFGAAKLSN
jgi:hypothetical protein